MAPVAPVGAASPGITLCASGQIASAEPEAPVAPAAPLLPCDQSTDGTGWRVWPKAGGNLTSSSPFLNAQALCPALRLSEMQLSDHQAGGVVSRMDVKIEVARPREDLLSATDRHAEIRG